MLGYRRVAQNQVLPALGKNQIANLTVEGLDRFYRALAKKGYSHSTIHQTHIVMRRVLESARRWGWISVNPAKDARPPQVATPDPTPVRLDEIMRLIEVADASYPEMAAGDLGLRVRSRALKATSSYLASLSLHLPVLWFTGDAGLREGHPVSVESVGYALG
jgi:site-specific recombinase XerD